MSLQEMLIAIRNAANACLYDPEQAPAWFRRSRGICGNLVAVAWHCGVPSTALAQYDATVSDLMGYWPGLSEEGSYAYPVGGKDEFRDGIANGTLWSNPRRLELLDYLIEVTKP